MLKILSVRIPTHLDKAYSDSHIGITIFLKLYNSFSSIYYQTWLILLNRMIYIGINLYK